MPRPGSNSPLALLVPVPVNEEYWRSPTPGIRLGGMAISRGNGGWGDAGAVDKRCFPMCPSLGRQREAMVLGYTRYEEIVM